jgi:hypothetical protein
MKFCTRCDNMYGYDITPAGANLKCNTCGHSEPFKPTTKEDALVLETNFRSGSSAGGAASGITVNAKGSAATTAREITLPSDTAAVPSGNPRTWAILPTTLSPGRCPPVPVLAPWPNLKWNACTC